MLALGIIEYFFYGLANNGLELCLLLVLLTDPAVWETEPTLLMTDAKIDPGI